MCGTGNVTPERVAPNEPTIDTTLIMILNAGNREKRNTANAYVESTNNAEVRFSGQNPQSIGISNMPKYN